jgi:4-aminobutyrate aminotransferase-like enzyme
MTRHRGRREILDAIAAHAGGGPRPLAQAADVVVARAEGCYVYAESGARLLDAVSGYGVASLGHSDPRWVEAVIAQARRLAVAPVHTAQLADYLSALAQVLPASMCQIALSSTGAEAVEMAVRLTQTSRGRTGVLTFHNSFHGKTAAVRYARDIGTPEARSLAPTWLHSAAFSACSDHDAADYADCGESPDDDIAELNRRSDLGDIAAVLVEPVLGTAGNIPPKRPFLRALRQLTRERDWLLIYDESITGFGRTGQLFAFDTFGAEPDILVLGKGLGGGFPLSAVCAAPELWADSALSAPSGTSSSYGANPLACAAGAVTLEIVSEPSFLEQVRVVSARSALRLRELAEEAPCVARPRGVGLMLGFDVIDPTSGKLATAEHCRDVVRACREHGVLVAAHVPRVRLSPPLTITAREAELLFDVLHEVLA